MGILADDIPLLHPSYGVSPQADFSNPAWFCRAAPFLENEVILWNQEGLSPQLAVKTTRPEPDSSTMQLD
jgi:hypothetical protein